MNVFQRWVGLVVLACSLSSGTTAAAKEKWIYARYENLEMYSSAGEKQSRQLLNDLVQFRAAFRSAFALPKTGETPVTIVLFASERQFEPYMPTYKGETKRVAGYFAIRPSASFIALCPETSNDIRETILHEYVHRLVMDGGYRPPVWLNEGLATVYQTTKIDKDIIEIGNANRRYIDIVGRRRLMPLERLVEVTQSSPEYNEKDQTGLFYGTSWVFTHYLLCGPDKSNSAKLVRFMDLASAPDANLQSCFQEAFGMTHAEMEKTLDDYLMGGRAYVRRDRVAVPNLAETIEFEPADDVGREVMLEHLLWRPRARRKNAVAVNTANEQHRDTEGKLLAIASRAPNSPKPYELLAHYALIQGEGREQAKYYWLKAAELGSTNPEVYFQLAALEMRDVRRRPSLDYRMPPVVADPLRAYLDRAIALRPDHYDAWEELAQVEAWAEFPRLAVIKRVQDLVQEMNSSPRTLFALAMIRWRYKDLNTCRQILEALESNRKDPFVNRLGEMLSQQLKKDAKLAAERAEAETP